MTASTLWTQKLVYPVVVAAGLVTTAMGAKILMGGTGFIVPGEADQQPLWTLLEFVVEVTIGPMAVWLCANNAWRVWRHGSPEENFLRLDDDGVSQVIWGRERRWLWAAISEPRFRKLWIGARFLAFAVPGRVNWKARLLPPYGLAVSRGRIVAVISNIFDTPLEDIEKSVFECRLHALGGEDPELGG